MRKAAAVIGMVLLAGWVTPAGARAAPSYQEAKAIYSDLASSAEVIEKGGKDCVKAGKGAATGILAWRKARQEGINKDRWWKKAKLSGFEKSEMALLYNTSFTRFQAAMVAGGKQCYNDPRFQDALTEMKGKDKK